MKTKHTPGPWHSVKTGNHQGLIVSETTGENIAVAYDSENAPLIAAAPELLEALIRCVTPIPDIDIERHRDRIAEINGIARSAIAKATGES